MSWSSEVVRDTRIMDTQSRIWRVSRILAELGTKGLTRAQVTFRVHGGWEVSNTMRGYINDVMDDLVDNGTLVDVGGVVFRACKGSLSM